MLIFSNLLALSYFLNYYYNIFFEILMKFEFIIYFLKLFIINKFILCDFL